MSSLSEDKIALSTIAFNRGCDDRLAGVPISANPFDVDTARVHWKMGWTHCNNTWGTGARWPVRMLPEIKEASDGKQA